MISLVNNALLRRRFRQRLLSWYDRERRQLPWREDRNPYRIWVSEIMLQQTRVAAVREHYGRFLQRFPNVEKLAAARESSVLAAWSGLGYYRRARMMHAAARIIVKQHAGRLPASSSKLFALPGIGRYTAAAIASIAFDEPSAAVDGNVERVIGRLAGTNLRGEDLWQTAQKLLAQENPGNFNQALMELGATICLPRRPRCTVCPVFQVCSTRTVLPMHKPCSRQKKQAVHYALHCQNDLTFLVKRPREISLMPEMWELPQIESAAGAAPWLTLRHSITATDFRITVSKSQLRPTTAEGRWVSRRQVARMPLTGLARKILRAANVI